MTKEDFTRNRLPIAATFAAALGSGALAGYIVAFSDVMDGLGRLEMSAGVATMNVLNDVVVRNPIFVLVFLGTPALSAILAAVALKDMTRGGSWATFLGALAMVIGVFGVTVGVHVPMNTALAEFAPEAADAQGFWREYLDRWTSWNHVRALSSITAALSFMVALIARAGGRTLPAADMVA